MKKLLSIALAVVMVLGVASVAMAFDWSQGATSTDPNPDFRFQISVEKYALQGGDAGSTYVKVDNISAVNDANVYYLIKLVTPSSYNDAEKLATVSVKFTGINSVSRSDNVYSGRGVYAFPANGTYYYNGASWAVYDDTNPNFSLADAVVTAKCFDAANAKIEVEVSSERDLENRFEWNGYDVLYDPDDYGIQFVKDTNVAIFDIAANGRASLSDTEGTINGFIYNDADFVHEVMAALGFTWEQLTSNSIYFTKTNLLNAFGYDCIVSDTETWAVSTNPIIVDPPVVSIPKTGDNSSVIGFAMIMVAVVAAAVAVKKVRA